MKRMNTQKSTAYLLDDNATKVSLHPPQGAESERTDYLLRIQRPLAKSPGDAVVRLFVTKEEMRAVMNLIFEHLNEECEI
jgi:hypothetical protein